MCSENNRRCSPSTLTSAQTPSVSIGIEESDLVQSDGAHPYDFVCWVRCLLAAYVAPDDRKSRLIGNSVFGNGSKQPTKYAYNCSAVFRV